MGWILWTLLISFGCFFIIFLMSCLNIAKQADEKIDQFGPSPEESRGAGLDDRRGTIQIISSRNESERYSPQVAPKP